MSLLQISQLEFLHCGPIDLEIDAGECVGISGKSGSGKTLLLWAIADLDEHRGELLLNNIAAEKIAAPQWRKQVALLPADSQWWFDTVLEHFGDVNEDLLKKLGFPADAMDWEISRISSGEKQRLALMRVLLNKPTVLLLDEPTTNLDRDNTLIFEQIVADYIQENSAAAIWISHDDEQLKRVSRRRLILENGGLSQC